MSFLVRFYHQEFDNRACLESSSEKYFCDPRFYFEAYLTSGNVLDITYEITEQTASPVRFSNGATVVTSQKGIITPMGVIRDHIVFDRDGLLRNNESIKIRYSAKFQNSDHSPVTGLFLIYFC